MLDRRRVAAAARRGREEPSRRQSVQAAEPLALRGRRPFRWATCSQVGQEACVTRQPDDGSGPNVPAGPGAKPLVWRLADAGSARLRFPHRRQPPADDRGAWPETPPLADRACCCPARPVVRGVCPPGPSWMRRATTLTDGRTGRDGSPNDDAGNRKTGLHEHLRDSPLDQRRPCPGRQLRASGPLGAGLAGAGQQPVCPVGLPAPG